jgi:hypothetical protein
MGTGGFSVAPIFLVTTSSLRVGWLASSTKGRQAGRKLRVATKR